MKGLGLRRRRRRYEWRQRRRPVLTMYPIILANEVIKLTQSVSVSPFYYGKKKTGIPHDTKGVVVRWENRERNKVSGKSGTGKFLIDLAGYGEFWCRRYTFAHCKQKMYTMLREDCEKCSLRFVCFTQK